MGVLHRWAALWDTANHPISTRAAALTVQVVEGLVLIKFLSVYRCKCI